MNQNLNNQSQSSQYRNPDEIIQDVVQFINENNIEKVTEILRDNMVIANEILQDDRIQTALRDLYKPTEEFCALPEKNDFDDKTLTNRVIMNMILRDQIDFSQYSNEEIAKIENFLKVCTWGVKDDGELYLNIDEGAFEKHFNLNEDNSQIIQLKDELIKLSEPFFSTVNSVKRGINLLISSMPKSTNADQYSLENERGLVINTETIPDICLNFFQRCSSENELNSLYESREEMVNLVKGMKELLINNRSMLKSKYLFNPDNKEESLNNADDILDSCLKLLRQYKPEDVIERLDTMLCCPEDNISGLYCMRDPEIALGRMLSFYKRFYENFTYLYHSNSNYFKDELSRAQEVSRNFWNKNEIKDAIKEAWPELADSLDKNISTGELRDLIARAITINGFCNTSVELLNYDKDSLAKIFTLCRENSEKFIFSYKDLQDDTYVKDSKPYYIGQGEEFEHFVNIVKNCAGQKVAIFTHLQPDCDAYGSSIALGLLMEKYGAKVSLFNASAKLEVFHNEILNIFGLRDQAGNDLVKISPSVPECEAFDKVILLDCDKPRVEEMLPRDYETYLRFDHHGNANFAQAMSTCEFVAYLYERLNQDEDFKNITHFESNILLDHSINLETLIPTILYAGCYDDSDGFSKAKIEKKNGWNLTRLKERLERKYRFLSEEIVPNLFEFACSSSYKDKFARYLSNSNRPIVLKNGLGMIAFNEADSSRFPDISCSVIKNKQVGLPENFIRIYPPLKNGSNYVVSLKSSSKGKSVSTSSPLGFDTSGVEDFKALRIAKIFGGGGNENAAGCNVNIDNLFNPDYVEHVVEEITKCTDTWYENSDLARNLSLLRSAESETEVRNALKYIALSREDYVEALKLSCPDIPLLDVGGMYINENVAFIALIFEAIPNVN